MARARGGSLAKGDLVGMVKVRFPFGGAEDVPALGRHPVDAGHVGGGDDAIDLEQIGVEFGTGGERDDGATVAVEVYEGEHLSADGLVSDPKEQIGTPLHGFDNVGEGQDESAEAFGVHAGECSAWAVRKG